MKFSTVLILIFTLFSYSNSAEFEFYPDNVYELNETPDSFNYPSVGIRYEPEASTYVLGWKLLEEDMNQFWDYSLCDYNTCYFDIPQEAHMQQLEKGGVDGFFKLNLIPLGFTGKGTIRLLVYDTANPSVSDTVTFKVNITEKVSASVKSNNEVSFFPNPVMEKLNVNSPYPISSYSILTTTGQEIMRKDNLLESDLSIDLSNLDNGVYLFSYISEGKKYFEKIVIRK